MGSQTSNILCALLDSAQALTIVRGELEVHELVESSLRFHGIKSNSRGYIREPGLGKSKFIPDFAFGDGSLLEIKLSPWKTEAGRKQLDKMLSSGKRPLYMLVKRDYRPWIYNPVQTASVLEVQREDFTGVTFTGGCEIGGIYTRFLWSRHIEESIGGRGRGYPDILTSRR